MTRDIELPRVSADYREMRGHRTSERIPQHQPKTEELMRCTWCGQLHRLAELAHVGDGAYKCRDCLQRRR